MVPYPNETAYIYYYFYYSTDDFSASPANRKIKHEKMKKTGERARSCLKRYKGPSERIKLLKREIKGDSEEFLFRTLKIIKKALP